MTLPQRAFVKPDYGPSYKPKDTDDVSKCIRRRHGHTEVWCVECEHWHSLNVTFDARVTLGKSGVEIIKPQGNTIIHCRVCHAVVDYIIDANGKRDEVVREYLGYA